MILSFRGDHDPERKLEARAVRAPEGGDTCSVNNILDFFSVH
jgi:hypothetical protein